MKSIDLRKFVTLHRNLIAEKAAIEARLAEINDVLGQSPAPAVKGVSKTSATKRGPKRRRKNEGSLKEFVLKVLTKPMNRQEILTAVQDAGYKFSSSNPLNSLGTLLYSNKKNFKSADGKFTKIG